MSDERPPDDPTPKPPADGGEVVRQPEAEVDQDAAGRAVGEVDESAEVDPGGVEALLRIAEDTVEAEHERLRALDQKTISLVGFSGLILSVNGAVAKPLFDADLGWAETPVKILFGFAILSLLAAVLFAVLGVIRPKEYHGFGLRQLQEFTTLDAQQMPRLVVHQRMLGAAVGLVGINRGVNDAKVKQIKRVGYFLAVGFVAVAAQAGVVGLSQIGASADQDECTRTVEVTSSRTGGSRTSTTVACPTPVPPPFETDVTPRMGP